MASSVSPGQITICTKPYEHRAYESKQAEHARHELREVRETCSDSDHRWWDPDERRRHTDRDWDEDDQPNYDPGRH
jgi:hypothetical protein